MTKVKRSKHVFKAAKQPSSARTARSGPLLKQNLVVFLDLLGFRDKMSTAARAGTSQTLLAEYDRVVGSALNILEDSEGLASYQYRGFTDNFVLAVPASNLADAETALGYLLIRVSEFQLVLAANGWFLRGAIVYGDFHMDDRLVFGSPVVEAYELESRQARDPRIILSERVAEMARKHLDYYADPFKSPHNGYLLQDVDGRMLVNYLYTPIGGDAGDSATLDWVNRHKLQVEAMLRTHLASPVIWSKYRWVAAYHDYFCKKWGGASGKSLKISKQVLRSDPELLVSKSNGTELA